MKEQNWILVVVICIWMVYLVGDHIVNKKLDNIEKLLNKACVCEKAQTK